MRLSSTLSDDLSVAAVRSSRSSCNPFGGTNFTCLLPRVLYPARGRQCCWDLRIRIDVANCAPDCVVPGKVHASHLVVHFARWAASFQGAIKVGQGLLIAMQRTIAKRTIVIAFGPIRSQRNTHFGCRQGVIGASKLEVAARRLVPRPEIVGTQCDGGREVALGFIEQLTLHQPAPECAVLPGVVRLGELVGRRTFSARRNRLNVAARRVPR